MKTIEEIRKAFLAMHHYATRENAPTYMSVPADRNRDADLILSAAIDELEKLRSDVIAAKADAARLREHLQERHDWIDHNGDESLADESDPTIGCDNSDDCEKCSHAEVLLATDSGAWLESKIAERTAELTKALTAINTIRSSIIATQSLNWSEHVYPLVAALDEVGFEGAPYPETRANFGTLLERLKSLEAQLVAATNDAARAELRARDLADALREHMHVASSDFDATFGNRVVKSFSTIGGVLQVFDGAPDSDERLREVMRRLAHKVQQRSLGNVLTESELVEVVEKELRGAP